MAASRRQFYPLPLQQQHLGHLLVVVLFCTAQASRQCRTARRPAAKCRKQIARCAVCIGCPTATSCKTCDSSWGNCNTTSPDCETNLNTTATHCGACNKSCEPGQTCEGGVCVGGPLLPPPEGSLAVNMDVQIASTCEVPDRTINASGTCQGTSDGYTLTLTQQELQGMLDFLQNPPRCVVVSTCDQQGSTAWGGSGADAAQLTMEWRGACAEPEACGPGTGLTRMLVQYTGSDEVITFGNAAGSVCGKPLHVTVTASFDCRMV